MSWKYTGCYRPDHHPDGDEDASFNNIVRAIQSNDIKQVRKYLKKKDAHLIDSQNLTVLHVAVRWGDADTLRTLLQDGRVKRLLERPMYNGDTPLLSAAKYINVPALRILIEHNADIGYKESSSGETVLHYAARQPDCNLMNVLLSCNPTSELLNIVNSFGDSALQIALKHHSPTVQVLLQAGADYSKPNLTTGRSLLHTSVAYGQCSVVQELLASRGSRKLVDSVDNRGDTPLMLAVRKNCFECVKSLIPYMKHGMEINRNTDQSVLHMAVDNDSDKILKHLLLFSSPKITNYINSDGHTPLHLAIEQGKYNCLLVLVKTQNIYFRNGVSGETALHTAIRVNNSIVLDLLLTSPDHVISWWMSNKNSEGKTPYWFAIEKGHDVFIEKARIAGWIDVDEANERGDYPTFVAAACGHLDVLKALLFSNKYYEFLKSQAECTDLSEMGFVRNAEVCCDIYESDIFILTEKNQREELQVCLPKSFLQSNLKTGMNIFHACALGENKLCLEFVFSLCETFRIGASLFDAPDGNGDTPLLLATKNDYEGPYYVHFFLSHKANISHKNNSGESVLKSMLVNTEYSTDIIFSVLNESIKLRKTVNNSSRSGEALEVDFSFLMPPNEPITKVVRLFYETIEGPHRTKLLQHILFKAFIQVIKNRFNYFFTLRFLLSCLSTTFLTSYILFFFSEDNAVIKAPVLVLGHRWVIGILSLLGISCSVPLLFCFELKVTSIFTATCTVLTSIMSMVLVNVPAGSDLSYELAAVTILVSFTNLMIFSTAVFKDISHQIAMLSEVICGMISYIRVLALVLIPFSLSFYCIFNDSFYFTSPIKSFIYTYFILLHGDTGNSFTYFQTKHLNVKSNTTQLTNYSGEYILDIVIESFYLLLFIITCVLGLINMLVGLAVRDGKTLSADADVFRRRLQIHWLHCLEEFLTSFFYKVIKRTPLVYLFGIVPTKTFVNLKPKYYPTFDRSSLIFPNNSMLEMRKSVCMQTTTPRSQGVSVQFMPKGSLFHELKAQRHNVEAKHFEQAETHHVSFL